MTDGAGRQVVVTGANSGVGRAATELIAGSGAAVVMVCRDEARGRKALAAIRKGSSNPDVRLELADLASLSSVRDLASRLVGRTGWIDVLVNNAGAYRARREISEDGFEMTMAVNHLGHFALTTLLTGTLIGGIGRVINVSSDGHRSGDLRRASLEEIFRGLPRYRGLQAYADSKLANVLFTFELSRRLGHTGLAAAALHPGVLGTRIWNQNRDPLSLLMRGFKPFMGRPSVGGRAVCHLAIQASAEEIDGKYFHVENERRAADQAYDADLASELWVESTRLAAVAGSAGVT
jgi:NAD(P)-dependent dehydrogenase (short-subunit alcohol dehydrogenase family)